MLPTNRKRRRGLTLVELITATTMLAALTATIVVLLRTSHAAWTLHRDDLEVRESALGALRHITRQVRQTTRVTSISAASETSGTLELRRVDGTRIAYAHDASADEALFGSPAADTLLARHIATLRFTGFKANGYSATVDPELIHAVRCEITYDLIRPSGTTNETVSCQAWLRSW